MTLFIRTPKRTWEIDELYVMILSCLIGMLVASVTKKVILKLYDKYGSKTKRKKIKNRTKKTSFYNPIGGDTLLQTTSNSELAYLILTCIADEDSYIVKNKEIAKMIFALVKAKIKNESLIISPNFLRYLAKTIVYQESQQSLLMQFKSVMVQTSTLTRLKIRGCGSLLIGIAGYAMPAMTFAQTLLFIVTFWDNTQSAGYNCKDHFQQVEKQVDSPTRYYRIRSDESATGQLLVNGNDNQGKEVEVYQEQPDKTTFCGRLQPKAGELTVREQKSYKRVDHKTREVKFSEFRKNDPVLSKFPSIEDEPITNQLTGKGPIEELVQNLGSNDDKSCGEAKIQNFVNDPAFL